MGFGDPDADAESDASDPTFELLGWPPEGPKLRLDYRRFSYAGKFVMTNTGKAVARVGDEVVGAIAFNGDRTDGATLWLRYVTVASEWRGKGIGPDLVSFARERAIERGYERFTIAVNNPFAYEALHRAGFGYTGETTGIAELVLESVADDVARTSSPVESSSDDPDRYRSGLEEFQDRPLSDDERAFVRERIDRGPPERSR